MTTVSDGTTPFPSGADTDTVALELPVAASPYGDLPRYHPEDAVPPTEPVGRPRRTTPSAAGRVVLPLGLALVSVVALGAGWLHLESDRAAAGAARASAGVAAAKPPVPALGDPSAPAASPPAASPPAASAAASAPAAPAVSAPAAPAASAPASSPAAAPPTTVDRSVPVVVYNATTRTGLAAKVAASLKAKGWTVVSVGNWRKGGISETTVFVSGERDAAATMLDDLAVDGSSSTPLASMPKNRVVVVIGKDYPRS